MLEIQNGVLRPRNATLGSETLFYFQRVDDGRIIIPPVWWATPPECRLPKGHDRSDQNCMCGYVKKEANSAHELERVSRLFERQRQAEFARVDEAHIKRMEAKMKEVRGKLHTAMHRSGISQFERDFIRAALKKLEAGEAGWRDRRVQGHFEIESTEAKRAR
jgi:hypothetical protein